MCKVGDIILVDSYKHGEKVLSKHSFVVIFDEAGEIHGLPFDIACNVMSSFHGEEHKAKKLAYQGNFLVTFEDSELTLSNPNQLDGYVKSDQLYLFNLSKIDYIVIGRMIQETFDQLIEFIESLPTHEFIYDNL